MQKIVILLLLLLVATPALLVDARQFSGCASEAERDYGARYQLHALNGFTFNVTAIGMGDFDPAITILGADGEIVTCSTTSRNRAQASVNLPSVNAPANPRTASVHVPVPGNQGRLDYTVIVTEAEGRNGEFVLIYDGAQVFGANDVDRFTIFTNAGQVVREVPLGIYALNLNRPQQALDPVLTFRYGGEFTQVCRKSSSRALCDGDTQDLTGFGVSLDGSRLVGLTGDDAMLFYEVGSRTAEFSLEVSSYQAQTFGPYVLIIHSGTGYPVRG